MLGIEVPTTPSSPVHWNVLHLHVSVASSFHALLRFIPLRLSISFTFGLD